MGDGSFNRYAIDNPDQRLLVALARRSVRIFRNPRNQRRDLGAIRCRAWRIWKRRTDVLAARVRSAIPWVESASSSIGRGDRGNFLFVANTLTDDNALREIPDRCVNAPLFNGEVVAFTVIPVPSAHVGIFALVGVAADVLVFSESRNLAVRISGRASGILSG